jgi:hypothetical protein
MFLGLDQLGQFLPLLLGGIDTGWVLGTSVEQELLSAFTQQQLGGDLRQIHLRLSIWSAMFPRS